MGPNGPMGGGSGGIVQDPTGFPAFHDTPPPPGPAPAKDPNAPAVIAVADAPLGGFRPQIAVGPDGTLHLVYYNKQPSGDILWYRTSKDGQTWSEPEQVSPSDGRNWGPDIVVRDDGRMFLAWDRAEADFRSRGWIRERGPEGWGEATPITEGGEREVGSGHIAVHGDDVAYVYIGKPLGMEHRFRATSRVRTGGAWSDETTWSDGTKDAWHTNIQSRPDGSALAGWDVGDGGSETTVYVSEWRDGKFSAPEDITATSHPGERVHFGFGSLDWMTWFHKVGGRPFHVYVRGGKPGAWGDTVELSRGFGGYHYDPYLSVSNADLPVVLWGWDGGAQAELLYSVRRGDTWTTPLQLTSVGAGKPELPSMDVDATGRFHVAWAHGTRGNTRILYTSFKP
jgi:hypothetical protein